MSLLVPVAEEGTDKDAISELMRVGPLKLFQGRKVSFPKEITFV